MDELKGNLQKNPAVALKYRGLLQIIPTNTRRWQTLVLKH